MISYLTNIVLCGGVESPSGWQLEWMTWKFRHIFQNCNTLRACAGVSLIQPAIEDACRLSDDPYFFGGRNQCACLKHHQLECISALTAFPLLQCVAVQLGFWLGGSWASICVFCLWFCGTCLVFPWNVFFGSLVFCLVLFAWLWWFFFCDYGRLHNSAFAFCSCILPKGGIWEGWMLLD